VTIFIIGLILFLGAHSTGIFAEQWRSVQVNKLGIRKWKIIYSIISIIGLILMTVGYKQHTSVANILVWSPPAWTWYFVVYTNLVPLILLLATYIPNNAIKVKLKDPMTIGIIIWAATHLAYVNSLAGIILFVSFLIWGILELIASRKRRENMATSPVKVSTPMTVLTIVLGVGLWLCFDRYAYYLRGLDWYF
jgi:uncharacterized membrane protein